MDENKNIFNDDMRKILDDAVNKILEAYYEIFFAKQQNNDYKKGDCNNE